MVPKARELVGLAQLYNVSVDRILGLDERKEMIIMSNLSVTDLNKTLQTIINDGADWVNAVFDSDAMKLLNNLGNDVSDAVGSLRILKAIADIPTRLFTSKFEKFCKGLMEVPIEKRQKWVRKLDSKRLNKESVFILTMIDKVEELDKLDIFVALFEACADGRITLDEFHRYVVRVDQTLVSDLLYMKEHLTGEDFYVEDVEQEGLLSSGWIVFSGIAIQDIEDEHETPNLYHYSDSTKTFCDIVFGH